MAWRWSALPTHGTAPAPRTAFASALFDGALIIAGGWDRSTAFDDMHALNLKTASWQAVPAFSPSPFANRILFAHASVEGSIYVHGGTSADNMGAVRDDLFRIDVAEERWEALATEGDGPGSVARHSMAAMGGSLWCFGGWDGGSFLEGAFRLRLGHTSSPAAGAVWERLEVRGLAPHARAHASLVPAPWSHHLLLFGGGDADYDFGDLYALDVQTLRWKRFDAQSGGPALSQPGYALLPERGGSGSLAIHGGFGGGAESEPTRQDAFHLLPLLPPDDGRHVRAGRWASPRALGEPPVARMGHALLAVNESCLLVFGGNADRSIAYSGDHLNDVIVAVPERDPADRGDEDGGIAPRADGGGEDEVIVRTSRVGGTRGRPPHKKKRRRPSRPSDAVKEEL